MHGCSIFLNFLNLMLYQTPFNQLNCHYILQRKYMFGRIKRLKYPNNINNR